MEPITERLVVVAVDPERQDLRVMEGWPPAPKRSINSSALSTLERLLVAL